MLPQNLRRAWPALAIVAAGLLAYAPAFSAGFVWDDHSLIEDSTLLRGILWKIWFSTAAKDYWPLTWTSLWVEWRLWGSNPTGYHVVNVALHLATSLLLWRVLRRLEIPGAWFAGLLFAVHPVTVESVAWLSERKNTLSGVFFMGAALQWVRFEETRSRRAWVIALGLFGAALLSKTSVVMFPVVLLASRLLRSGRVSRRDVAETAPFFALSLVAGAATVWFQHEYALLSTASGRGIAERIGGAGWALLSYAEIAFLPIRIGVVYPSWPVRPSSLLWFAPLLLIVAAFVALWRARRRPAAHATLAALGFHALMLAPVLGLVDMAYLAVGPVSNHLQYVALAGPVALLAIAGHALAERWRTAAWVAATVVVVLCGTWTWTRASAFESDETLWAHAVREQPGSAAAHFQHAQLLLQAGGNSEALTSLQAVERLASTPGGRLRARMQRQVVEQDPEAAIATAREILDVTADPDLRRDAALTLMDGGYLAEAAATLEALVRQAPASSDYSYWFAAVLMRAGRPDDAEAVLRRYAATRPGHPKIEQAYAFVLLRMGLVDQARERAAAVAGVAPDDPRAEEQLAVWMEQAGWSGPRGAAGTTR